MWCAELFFVFLSLLSRNIFDITIMLLILKKPTKIHLRTIKSKIICCSVSFFFFSILFKLLCCPFSEIILSDGS